MKWGQIERQRGVRAYGPADEIVAFAAARGMTVKGHALVWHGDSPAWLESLSTAEVRSALREHVAATRSGAIAGASRAWDVVNEAIADDRPGLRDTVYLRKLGPDYVAEAFALAHEADPDALLVYNDYGGEGLNRKSDDVYALVRDLVAPAACRSAASGLQMHLDAASRPATADIARNVARLAALGLRVNISEMDVRVARVAGDRAAKLAEQRRVYHDVVAVCLAEPRCDAITFWGFTDRHSWIDAFFGPDDPLLFDDATAPSPRTTASWTRCAAASRRAGPCPRRPAAAARPRSWRTDLLAEQRAPAASVTSGSRYSSAPTRDASIVSSARYQKR